MTDQGSFSAPSETANILDVIQTSAKSGTLLSSCDPEVHELMFQISSLISERRKECEAEVVRVNALLERKQHEMQLLKVKLAEKEVEVEQLKRAYNSKEKEHRAYSADFEAQLMRIRSESNRLSQNYEQLKEKYYCQHQERGAKGHLKGIESMTKVMEFKHDLERSELKLHLSKQELKKAQEKIAMLEAEQQTHVKDVKQLPREKRCELNCEEFACSVEKRIMEQHTSLQPQQTSQILEELLDKHFQNLNHEILKMFDS